MQTTGEGRYLYFLSYAWQDYDEYVSRFASDLERTARRLGAESSVGFPDTHGPIDALPWQEALSSSQAFICLLSPNYLKSELCLRSLSLFRSRLEASTVSPGEPNLSRIFPVQWFPITEKELPAVVRDLQPPFPLGPAYSKGGLRYLIASSSGNYREFLRRFAESLIKAVTFSPPTTTNLATQIQPSRITVPQTGSPTDIANLSLDPLTLTYRLVLDGKADPDLLLHLEPSRIREAAARLCADRTGIDQLVEAQRILDRNHPGAEPNPLWRAWMEATRANALQDLNEKLLS